APPHRGDQTRGRSRARARLRLATGAGGRVSRRGAQAAPGAAPRLSTSLLHRAAPAEARRRGSQALARAAGLAHQGDLSPFGERGEAALTVTPGSPVLGECCARPRAARAENQT